MGILDNLFDLKTALLKDLEEFSKKSEAEKDEAIQQLNKTWVGKQGELTAVMKEMKNAEPAEKKEIGQMANSMRQMVLGAIDEARLEIEKFQLEQQLTNEIIDVTLPGRTNTIGVNHLLLQVSEQLEDLFISMGYEVKVGPEVETDLYNFEKLNLPKDHPARDMQDTFYITNDTLMRTQTSPVQARTMEKHDFTKGPLKMICPGKVYRRDDDDATHSHQFMQMEGLVVDKHITMGDLKGTLQVVAQKMFGEDRTIRLRPSYFPFTEPSVEVDVSCFKCGGSGCSVCKQTGWIEVLGAGMVHPNVLEMSGIDSTVYGGFAFGLGIERIAMLKYGVDDIRHFYQNDNRFIEQFSREEI